MKRLIGLVEYFDKQSKLFLMLLGILLLTLVWFVDCRLNWRINFSPGYVIPIIFVTWFVGRKAGIAIAICSGILSFTTVVSTGYLRSSFIFNVYNSIIRPLCFLLVVYFLSEFRILLERERYFGRFDYLTGLVNKRQFDEMFSIVIQRSLKYQEKFTVVYMDIDYFKTINDRFGHHVGNILLSVVAKIIKKNIRSVDVAARIGGDEFTILMPETGRENAEVIVNKLDKGLMDVMQKNKWPVTFSFGVVMVERQPKSANEILKVADKLMYFSKSKGDRKINYEVYNG